MTIPVCLVQQFYWLVVLAVQGSHNTQDSGYVHTGRVCTKWGKQGYKLFVEGYGTASLGMGEA